MSVKARVFLHELPWDLRSRNTDWRYFRFALPQLDRYEEDLVMYSERSVALTLRGNAHTIGSALLRRLGYQPGMYRDLVSRLSQRELLSSGSNVIYSRTVPGNADGVPVVWDNAIVDPEMQRSYGCTEDNLNNEFNVRGSLFQRAAAVQVYSDAEAERHRRTFPDIAAKFVPVPFFAPHIHACDASVLDKHYGPAEVRILFVGNNAKRKGLDQLLQAFLQLPKSLQARSSLRIISHFDRSDIAVPTHDRIVVMRGAPSSVVMQEMAQAHIFVNVARLETYGVVFHEAMAQGAACLGPDWEVQRELLDYNRAGLNLPCEAGAIQSALERLIVDETWRHALATAGWQRFRERYAPAVVAARYAALFRSVANGSIV